MIDALAIELLITLGRQAFSVTPGQRGAWLRKVESQFAAALSPEATVAASSRSFTVPDIVLRRPSLETDLAVELKALDRSTYATTIGNRISELTAHSVAYRRLSHGPLTVVAVLLLTSAPTLLRTKAHKELKDDEFRGVATRLLRNFEDGVGFDAVAIGSLDDEQDWRYFVAGADDHGRVLPLPGVMESILEARAVTSKRPELAETPPTRKPGPLRFLLVADEWSSGYGGLSTLNREMAVALAKAGCDVSVAVPQADSTDRDDASSVGVRLATPSLLPGLSGKELLMTRPIFQEADYYPDAIIGHGRILGPFALALQVNFFPTAKRIHVVHTDAEQLESAKEQPGGFSNMMKAEQRRELETKLAGSADLVLGIGPLLAESISHQMRGFPTRTPPVVQFVPGPHDWGDTVDPADPPIRPQVLVMGRAEDGYLKGIDIAARGLLAANARVGHDGERLPYLVIRGVKEEDALSLKVELERLLSPHVKFFIRPYVTDLAVLKTDLWQSQIVLMPSRHEGFGLSAYEAIAAGVPVLISEESGLAHLLLGIDAVNHRYPETLSVLDDEDRIVSIWGDAIFQRLCDPAASFSRASALREKLAEAFSWHQATHRLLSAYRDL